MTKKSNRGEKGVVDKGMSIQSNAGSNKLYLFALLFAGHYDRN